MGTIHHPGPACENSGLRRSSRLGSAARRVAAQLAGVFQAPAGDRAPTARAGASIAVCERLEVRQFLSATVGPVVVGGELTFYGTKKADKIEVSRNADGLKFTLNGTNYQVNDAVTKVTILGLGGADAISVFDTAQYEVGDVTIDGGGGADKISGGNGDDHLYGGGGNDLVQGGNGADYVDGAAGNDRLTGGRGVDRLVGGSGKNVYNAGNDVGDTDDAGTTKRNLQSTVAARPTTTEGAVPLQVFGSVTGLTPTQVRTQYAFGDLADQTYTNRGAGQAVAVVIPYNIQSSSINTSVNTFSTQFGLPQVDTNTLAIINAGATTPQTDPDPQRGWEAEAALQLEWIHAIAPLAQLYLVLADSDLFTDLFAAVDKAVDTLVSRHGGGVAVMSFGSQTGELNPSLQAYLDASFTRKAAKTVTFVAGSGDASVLSYPSVSPYVVSVGGTSLQRDTLGGLTGNETGWTLGGGGIVGVASYPRPAFQNGTTVSGTQVARRATPDLAFNADPNSGLSVYIASGFGDVDGDLTNDSGWLPGGAGGTSAASPIAAGLIVLANEQRAGRQRGFIGQSFNDVIYDLNRVYPGGYFTDIVGGTSGTKTAVAGYDLVTGNGSPKAQLLIDRLASAGLTAISSRNLQWFGEFKEAITKVGSLSSGAGGFINGTGAVAGNNQLAMVLTPPNTSTTPYPPDITSIGGNTSGHQIDPLDTFIQISNILPVTLVRLEDNTVTGTGRVDITILLRPTDIPAPTDPTSPPPPPGPAPNPTPGFFDAGLDDSQPPLANGEIRTWRIDLNFTGKVARDSKGKEHVSGTFINRFSLYNPGGEPVEGLEPVFRGTFKA
ncbi:hypothetical protein [Humisphaera borealis]|uniref:Peptidase S53 domain-containing protein n=1 Tax=Humisphaera borealis TaxID=2807512 RepID=A0A7M2WZV4_9BACT|nr:hypothetical protein [Humisphaera borealis]QOV90933.1 hypothetical protein IPV69_06110 [Humisphaera borealis]